MEVGIKSDILRQYKIMETSTYEQWGAHEHLPDNFYLSQLQDERGFLKLFFKELVQSVDKQLNITFKSCLAYRVAQESGRLRSLENSNLRSFNRTIESEFISWFKDEALGIYDDRLIVQYTIVNLDNIIDVISEHPPTVEWISPTLAQV